MAKSARKIETHTIRNSISVCVLTCVHSCKSTFRICISYNHVLIKIFISFHPNNTYKYHFYLVTCNQAAKKYFAISSSSIKVRRRYAILHLLAPKPRLQVLAPASEPGLGSQVPQLTTNTLQHIVSLCARKCLF